MRPTPALLLALVACSPPADEPADDTDTDLADPEDVPFPIDELPLTGFVDPFIGTDGPGNVIPGAVVPHGMVRASPDTLSEPGSIDAYEHGDGRLEGFTHTHLEGPGGSLNGYSQLLVLPQTGALELDREDRARPFDPDTEVARPGLYEVTTGDGVRARLTATGHAAVHRYAFPAGPARLVLDVGHSNGNSVGGVLDVDGSVVRGAGHYVVHPIAALATQDDGRTAYSRVYLHAEASIAPTEHGTWQGMVDPVTFPDATHVEGAWSGAWIGWTFDEPTTVELRVGVSMISPDQAADNLAAEVGDASFDDVVDAADAAWNAVLNRVQIQADDTSKTAFYTALYRTFLQPADYTEAGGRYAIAASGEVHVRDAGRHRYLTDDWCMWDTYRTSHPLASLTEPELRDDVATSMLRVYQEGGWLPKCTWNATGYSRVMIGSHAVPVLADMVAKGLDGFDTELAWEAIDHAGTADIPGMEDGSMDGLCGYVNLGTPPDYLALGYVPSECDPGQSVSMTLEHAQDDHAAARFAEALGREADAERYLERAESWRVHLNDDGFMQARMRDGSWKEPFDPEVWGDFNDFCEANSWIYTFHVMQDVPGLVQALGGTEAFVAKLDRFVDEDQFDPTNQPSFHIPWLYAEAGRPEGTAERVRDLITAEYGTGRDGLPGNDDAGSTSALLVLAMLGLYPMSPGDPVWTISPPAVDGAVLHLHPGFYGGGTLTLEVDGDPDTDRYIQAVTLNDTPVDGPHLAHADLVAGGVLRVTLGAEPSDWGVFDLP